MKNRAAQPGRMKICIFCPSPLDGATKPEHILQDALGGRKTTRSVVCSRCNNTFGAGIDKAFVEQFAGIRNLLQLRSGTGRSAPALRNIMAGRDKINIEGDGGIRLIGSPFTIANGDRQGTKILEVRARSFEQIEALIPHMAAACGVPEQRLRELISTSDATIVERRPDPIRLNFAFGGSEAMRSVTKACLVLWATLVGNEEVRRPAYDEARRFVTDGGASFLTHRTFLDARDFVAPEGVFADYAPAFNLIYVKSNEDGRVIAYFTAFNLIAFSVVLAESGGSPGRQIALVSNPVTCMWSDKIAEKLNTPFEWLDGPVYDDETVQRSLQRLDVIMRYYLESAAHQEHARIIQDVLKGHGLQEGDKIPKEMANSIATEIAERVAHNLFNITYTKTIGMSRFGKSASSPKAEK